MSLRCGIVGLPNVGKSTLFNALTSSAAAEAANYPFCTIEPNFGCVNVPDVRLDELAALAGSRKLIPAQVEFVDIAGLVRGAHEGAGLGNQFLSHIREVDCIMYVLRCFKDDDIVHVEGRVDPISDSEVLETELILADIQSLGKRIPAVEKKAKRDTSAAKQLALMQQALECLNRGKPVCALQNEENAEELKLLQLLTSKPVLYVCNVAEGDALDGNEMSAAVERRGSEMGAKVVLVSAQIEQEIASLSEREERDAFLATLGMKESGLSKLIRAAYSTLGLITFFTVGPKEAHAWTVAQEASAPQAAGVIHTDFERGFICAEVIAYADYLLYRGEAGARDAGALRIEGKGYKVIAGVTASLNRKTQ